MLAIALSTLRERTSAFAGAFVALAVASVLVTACGILLESSLRAGAPTERYAGTPVVVAGKQSVSFVHRSGEEREVESVLLPERRRIDPAVAERLRGLPEVARVVPDVSISARLFRGDREVPATKTLWAHGWDAAALTPFRLTAGRPPRPGEIVVDAGLAARGRLAPGDRVTLTGPAPQAYRVAGVAAPTGKRLVKQSAVFLDPAAAFALNGGRADALGVLPADGVRTTAAAKAVRAALRQPAGRAGGARPEGATASGRSMVVHTGKNRGKAEFLDIAEANEGMVAMSGSFGGIALMVAIFVVAGTFAFSVQQRYRELGLLRAIGATPRQVRRMVAGEALAISVVAAIAGFLPGVGLAQALRSALVDRGIVTDSFEIAVGLVPFLSTLGGAVITAQLAVFAAGRRASRIRPTEALTEAAVPPRRLGVVRILLGLAFAAGGAASGAAAMAVTGEDAAGASVGVVMCFMIAVGLLGPLLSRVVLAIVGPALTGLSRVSGFLAMANGRSDARRMASVFTPIVLCVAIACTLVFLQTTQAHVADEQGRDRVVADHILRGDPGLPASLVDEVRALPGVRAAEGVAPTSIVTRGLAMEWPAQAVTSGRLDALLDLDVKSGDLGRLRGRTVALSKPRAEGMGVHVGETVRVWLGDGTPVRLKVVAIFKRGFGFADYVVPREVVAAHATSPLVDSILVRGEPAALKRLAARWPGMEVLGAAELRSQDKEDRELNAWANYLLAGLLIVFTAIAVVNTLVMATGERTREFAVLRLSGATPRQVLRMVRCEAMVVAAVAAALGSAIAAGTLVPFAHAIAGGSLPYAPPLLYAAIFAGSALLALGASLAPTRLALRTPPVRGIGVRE